MTQSKLALLVAYLQPLQEDVIGAERTEAVSATDEDRERLARFEKLLLTGSLVLWLGTVLYLVAVGLKIP